jgi:hypothetical protein
LASKQSCDNQQGSAHSLEAGLPDGFFSDQKNNLGLFWRALELKMLIYILVIRNNLQPLGIFYGHFIIL